jgi:geranylgeranylglycerol-phosphate geranylgeranyltransferase
MGYVAIIRPINCIITFVSVLVGAWIGTDMLVLHRVLLAGIVGFFVCAFGNVVNDLYDIEIDRINNPQRPLPAGRVKKKNVIVLATLFFIISAVISMSLGIVVFLLALGAVIALFFYASYIKKTPWSNFMIALISGASFILGGLVTKNYACIFPFLFSFFIHVPREVIKDITDIKGDKTAGVASLPIVVGVKQSFNLSALLLCILCLVLPLPFLLTIVHATYIIIVLLLAYPLIIYTIVRLLQSPRERELVKLSTFLKISMVVGLVAMVI